MKTGLLRVLVVEDVPADAELCVDVLRKAGISAVADVCADAKDFEEMVSASEYDIILADYNLTTWNGIDAIETVRRLGKDTPVIVVTGALGDEKAVDCLHQGAADYVLKDRLGRLPSAVRRGIDESILRRQSRLLGAAVCSIKEGVLIAEAATDLSTAWIVSLNEAFAHITGYAAEELIGQPLSILQATEARPEFFANRDVKTIPKSSQRTHGR